ncbi:hypothetical protein V5N11_013074 [Cardamine amara subsp. amara]|uniref:Uncharacterized protein n=1 Tax=Cardamine amara subsp. amara TaxID=228776 RepID=A0ABD0ZYW5_CARAN
MGKWGHRPRFHRRRSPERWYSECHSSSSSSGYGEEDGIPVWEKRFCEVIGSVPWQKVVEASYFKSCYRGNVITWNDSACEETFHNEKKRFWSQVNGFHCDVSLPDPDLFISEIDWDTFIDPELIRDLERAYFAPPDEVKTGFKRGRLDKNWSLPIEETSWNGSEKVHDFNALGKKSNGWNLSESGGTDHPKDRETKDKGNDNWGNSGQGKDGWDKLGYQNKKAKGSESVSAENYNPWEAKPSCRNDTAEETTWGGCSGKGWEDKGWSNDCWGNGGWDNRDWGNQGTERKDWRYNRYSQNFPEPKGYNPWKGCSLPNNAAWRNSGVNADSWQTRRTSETKQSTWDVRRSNDGWGRQNKERDDSYGYRSNYTNSRPRRNDYQNRKVNF